MCSYPYIDPIITGLSIFSYKRYNQVRNVLCCAAPHCRSCCARKPHHFDSLEACD